jgi:hypothetical protein
MNTAFANKPFAFSLTFWNRPTGRKNNNATDPARSAAPSTTLFKRLSMYNTIGQNQNQGNNASIERRLIERGSPKYESHDSRRKAATSHIGFIEQFCAVVADSGDKQESMAFEMNIDPSLITHWKAGRSDMPAWRLIQWTLKVGPALLEWIAAKCGYALVPIETVSIDISDFETAVKLFFENTGAIFKAAHNGSCAIETKGLCFLNKRITDYINAFNFGEVQQ